MNQIKKGDKVIYRLDGKEYEIIRTTKAIMVGTVFWFIDNKGNEKVDAKKNYTWFEGTWVPKEKQW